MKTILHLPVLAILLISIVSCGDDTESGDCDLLSFYADIQDEFDAALEAGRTWGNDPTSENCALWKSATQRYLDRIEAFDSSNCNDLDFADYNAEVEEARKAVENVNCD